MLKMHEGVKKTPEWPIGTTRTVMVVERKADGGRYLAWYSAPSIGAGNVQYFDGSMISWSNREYLYKEYRLVTIKEWREINVEVAV